MKSKALIELLSDGQVHSGAALAEKLGVSRTAIWKQIRRAMEEGAASFSPALRSNRSLQPNERGCGS